MTQANPELLVNDPGGDRYPAWLIFVRLIGYRAAADVTTPFTTLLATLRCLLDRLPVGHMYSRSVSQGSNNAMSTESLRGSDAISVRELADMRSAGREHTVLDVREARELDICQLEGALHIPMAEIPARTDDLPTNQPLVVICHHGARSQMVVDFLRNAGFDNASQPRRRHRCLGLRDRPIDAALSIACDQKGKYATHAAD